MPSSMDYSTLPTPAAAVADFCLIPIGTTSPSVSGEVAAVQRLMKSSGLSYTMHSAGTTVEGTWDQVMHLIGQAHTLVHQNGVLRVQTDIRVGSRTDKTQHFSEKVSKVESILAADEKPVEKPVEKKVLVNPVATQKQKEAETAAAAAKAAEEERKKEPLTPATHAGSWASMLRN